MKRFVIAALVLITAFGLVGCETTEEARKARASRSAKAKAEKAAKVTSTKTASKGQTLSRNTKTSTPTATVTKTVTVGPNGQKTTSTTTSTPDTDTATCRMATMSIREYDINRASGRRYVTYQLRNDGAKTCTLSGTPRVSVTNAKGTSVPMQFNRAPAGAAIRLQPGEAAYFEMSYGNAEMYDPPSVCSFDTVAVRMPGRLAKLTIGANVPSDFHPSCYSKITTLRASAG